MGRIWRSNLKIRRQGWEEKLRDLRLRCSYVIVEDEEPGIGSQHIMHLIPRPMDIQYSYKFRVQGWRGLQTDGDSLEMEGEKLQLWDRSLAAMVEVYIFNTSTHCNNYSYTFFLLNIKWMCSINITFSMLKVMIESICLYTNILEARQRIHDLWCHQSQSIRRLRHTPIVQHITQGRSISMLSISSVMRK